MTNTTIPPYAGPQRVTQVRVLLAEWTKLRTQPAAAWAAISTGVLVIGVGVLYALLRVTRPPHGAEISTFDAAGVSLSGTQLAQIAIGVLGVLLISNEYANGLIRTTFTAVPRRLPVLWAKVAACSLFTVLMCVPFTFVAFFGGQSILAGRHLNTTLSAPGVLRAVVGSALYLGVVGLLGLGLGGLIRNTAGAIGALLGALFGLQILAGFLPGGLSDDVDKYLPAPAGQAVTVEQPDSTSLSPWVGLGVFVLYTAIVLALAAVRMRGRDT
jgi:ABC-type transport system involved in multi-copper enzyme maturation permease subunit